MVTRTRIGQLGVMLFLGALFATGCSGQGSVFELNDDFDSQRVSSAGLEQGHLRESSSLLGLPEDAEELLDRVEGLIPNPLRHPGAGERPESYPGADEKKDQ